MAGGAIPYPLWPLGHLPLIRGVVLPYRLQEKLPSLGRGAPWGSRQNCTGSGGSAKPGAAVETHQLAIFRKSRAQWPGGNLDSHSYFACRKFSASLQVCVPRNGVRGKRPMDLGGTKWSRSPSDASPGAFCLLFRHGKRRSPPTGGETPPEKQKNAPALALNDQRGRVLILGKEPEQPVRTGRSRLRSSAACACDPFWCRPDSPAG